MYSYPVAAVALYSSSITQAEAEKMWVLTLGCFWTPKLACFQEFLGTGLIFIKRFSYKGHTIYSVMGLMLLMVLMGSQFIYAI